MLADDLRALADAVEDMEVALSDERTRVASLEADLEVAEGRILDLSESVAALEDEVAGEDA